MALHEQSVGRSSDWRTPCYIFSALGSQFDLNVASPGQDLVPWIPARRHITANSLSVPWEPKSNFVWMNCPFGPRNAIIPWLQKFTNHANGIALVPDRTSCPWWQHFVPESELVSFVAPKIKFIGVDGTPGSSPAQGTCLLAIGQQGVAALQRAAANGLGVLMIPQRIGGAS
jgi:hypothetical protein